VKAARWSGAMAILRAYLLASSLLNAAAGQQLESQLPAPPAQSSQESSNELTLTVGKSVIIESALPVERISVGFGDIAEATAVGPRQILVNGKAPGVTTLIIWQEGETRRFYNVTVVPSRFLTDRKVEGVQREIDRELSGQTVTVSVENETVFLRGTVNDLTSADRAISIASTIGKTVNLLYVHVPRGEPQILLRVTFASVDRSITTQLGLNIVSTGAANTIGSITTQQFSPPAFSSVQSNTPVAATLSDALNLFFFRSSLNLGATIQALEIKGLLEVLSEPNMVTENGKPASFLAGGEFPFPSVSASGSGVPVVSIQFREYGVRLTFTPTITPRGDIQLQVAPEVSALDFTNGLTISGFNVPALTTRKMNTQVELHEGESFAIGGLLDNRATDSFEKIPFIGDIPILGKLFQSKSTSRTNTELIVIVTPELVRAIPAGQPVPKLKFTRPFLEPNTGKDMRTPGRDVTGPGPSTLPDETIPMEKLIQSMQPVAAPVQQIPAPTAPAGPITVPPG
jgi:pilus assembly protein CpaC